MSDKPEMVPKKRPATRRRGNGEGSIFLRADGRWVATITVGYAASGKRQRRTVYGATKREVAEKLSKLQTKKLDGTLTEANRLTLAEFLSKWLDDSARLAVRPTSFRLYEGIVRNHVNPRLGGVGLARITPAAIQGLYSSLESDGASPRLRQLAHAVLRMAFKKAVRWGLAVRNPCDAVDPPRVAKKTMSVLSPAEAVRLLDAASGHRLEALFVLAVMTGMRQGELFALRWRDIDLEAGAITVRHTLVELPKPKGGEGDGFVLGEPKSAKSRRRVDLSPRAIEALHEHRRRMLSGGHTGSPWVFCDSQGGHLRKSNLIRQVFKPLLRSAGLPDIRFHDLRHTSATLMLADGIHPKVVQERLGHSTIGLTMDTYSHVLPGMGRDAANRMDGILGRAGGEKLPRASGA